MEATWKTTVVTGRCRPNFAASCFPVLFMIPILVVVIRNWASAERSVGDTIERGVATWLLVVQNTPRCGSVADNSQRHHSLGFAPCSSWLSQVQVWRKPTKHPSQRLAVSECTACCRYQSLRMASVSIHCFVRGRDDTIRVSAEANVGLECGSSYNKQAAVE